MKKLIYIPIVHNSADLGSLGSRLSAEGARKYGDSLWRDHLEQVDSSWNNVEIEIYRRLKRTPLNRIKIYQDGLPVVDEIGIKIVNDAAKNGSKNYLIIERLLARGARLELAENKELLLSEYSLLSDIKNAVTQQKQLESFLTYQKVSQELQVSRDLFIANQINVTLHDGEMGIAFFGASHAIIDKIDKDIKVTVIQMFKDSISLSLIRK